MNIKYKILFLLNFFICDINNGNMFISFEMLIQTEEKLRLIFNSINKNILNNNICKVKKDINDMIDLLSKPNINTYSIVKHLSKIFQLFNYNIDNDTKLILIEFLSQVSNEDIKLEDKILNEFSKLSINQQKNILNNISQNNMYNNCKLLDKLKNIYINNNNNEYNTIY